jgi:DNA-binding MarR family transcriptional regulator
MEAIALAGVEPAQQADAPHRPDGAVVTLLGLVEGEVLTHLEEHGTTTLRGLIRALDWPAPMVTMGVGVLIRHGLVNGVQRDLEVVLEPRGERAHQV